MSLKLPAVFIIYFLFICSALADIDVVYPAKSNVTINAPSTFIFGNTTDEGAKVYINSKPARLWNNNFFVEVMPLKYGENKFVIKSVYNDESDEKIYIINRKHQIKRQPKSHSYTPRKSNEYLYSRIITDSAAVRQKPTVHSTRIMDLPKDVVLYLSGKQGSYYKIEEKGETEFWIYESNLEPPVSVSKKIELKLTKIEEDEDKLYTYKKFHLSYPVMYSLKQEHNKIILTLYGVQTKDSEGNKLSYLKYKSVYNHPILGYDCYYDGNILVLRTAKIPKIKDKDKPLKGINIFVDAGHGGDDSGAIGPTRIKEKDINLAIANNLIKLLENAGANVSFSRNKDEKAGLYERAKIAKKHKALISVSIHNNSLPSGKDPYLRHGTEVHYYNNNAKELAKIIQKNMVNDLNLKDNGIRKSSFVMTRSTNPISVLIEAAYIINPNEYILLQNEDFQLNIAKTVKKSIEEYILSLKNY